MADPQETNSGPRKHKRQESKFTRDLDIVLGIIKTWGALGAICAFLAHHLHCIRG